MLPGHSQVCRGGDPFPPSLGGDLEHLVAVTVPQREDHDVCLVEGVVGAHEAAEVRATA